MMRRLLNSGVLPNMPETLVHRVRVVNLASMVVTTFLCLLVLVALVRQLWGHLFVYALFAAVCALPLNFNRLRRHTEARVVILAAVATIQFIMYFLIRSESNDLMLICILFLGIFLADSRNERLLLFVGAMLFYLLKHWIPVIFNLHDLPRESVFGFWLSIAVGSIGLVAIVDLFKTDGRRYEEMLSLSNAQLEQKHAEIEAQRAVVQRQTKVLAAKTADAATVNRDIQDSIRYARRIQTSMLLTKEQLRHRLPGSLLFFKPKDVLSGDFYWFTEVDGYLFLAIADCTGHGVPGAMMTVLGNNLLHQIVGRDHVMRPADILAELDRRIVEMLGQRNASGDVVNDGMDMALIRIDRGASIITFASAKRPMFAFHGTGGDLTEYPASKQSIGGHATEHRVFTEKNIPFGKGDMVYLTTDGFADQFGPQGKFLPKRFRQLLRDIYRKPMPEQHRLLNETILRWRVMEPQTDDILVFGFHAMIPQPC